MKKCTGALVCTIAVMLSSHVDAQTNVPASLPIGTIEELKAYAFEHVTFIELDGRALTSTGATNDEVNLVLEYPRTNGVVDVEEIFAVIRGQQLNLLTMSSTVRVAEDVNLFDTNGVLLFFSSASAQLNPPTNNVSTNILTQVLDMNSFVPICFSNAVSAVIVQRDVSGNIVRTYTAPVDDGTIFFPAYFSSKTGVMTVQLADGTSVNYSLTGALQGPSVATQTVVISQTSARGVETFRSTNGVPMNIWVAVSTNDQARSISPLVQLVNTRTNQFDIGSWLVNPSGALATNYASSFKIWSQGRPLSTPQTGEITSTSHHQVFTIFPGRYWIRFIYPNGYGSVTNQFGVPDPVLPPPPIASAH